MFLIGLDTAKAVTVLHYTKAEISLLHDQTQLQVLHLDGENESVSPINQTCLLALSLFGPV